MRRVRACSHNDTILIAFDSALAAPEIETLQVSDVSKEAQREFGLSDCCS